MDIQQMRQWVQEMFETQKYNYMHYIKRNSAVYSEIQKCYGKNDKEKAFNFANPTQKTSCEHGGVYNFVSITAGYAFCSKNSSCICAQKAKGKNFRSTMAEKKRVKTAEVDAEFAEFYAAVMAHRDQ